MHDDAPPSGELKPRPLVLPHPHCRAQSMHDGAPPSGEIKPRPLLPPHTHCRAQSMHDGAPPSGELKQRPIVPPHPPCGLKPRFTVAIDCRQDSIVSPIQIWYRYTIDTRILRVSILYLCTIVPYSRLKSAFHIASEICVRRGCRRLQPSDVGGFLWEPPPESHRNDSG